MCVYYIYTYSHTFAPRFKHAAEEVCYSLTSRRAAPVATPVRMNIYESSGARSGTSITRVRVITRFCVHYGPPPHTSPAPRTALIVGHHRSVLLHTRHYDRGGPPCSVLISLRAVLLLRVIFYYYGRYGHIARSIIYI